MKVRCIGRSRSSGVVIVATLLISCGASGADENALPISGSSSSTAVGGSAGSKSAIGSVAEIPGVSDAVLAASWEATFQIAGLGCVKTQVGTAFVADAGRLITNAHVVAGVSNLRVVGHGREFTGRVVNFDPVTDLAVIAVEERLPDPLLLGEVTAGEPVAILGYDRSGAPVARAGRIDRAILATGKDIYGNLAEGRRALEISGRVETGFSGGPVVAPSGAVVGVIFSRTRGGAPVTYAVQTAEVTELLDDTESDLAGTYPCN